MKSSTKSSTKEGFKPKLIIDSSVAIKLLTKEEPFYKQSCKVFEDYLLGRIEIHVPDIFWWEIGNYFGREADLKTATIILMNLKKYRFPTHLLTDSLSISAFKIMHGAKGTSFYDASYHSLAIQTEGTFLTSDKKYVTKAEHLGSICLLADYR